MTIPLRLKPADHAEQPDESLEDEPTPTDAGRPVHDDAISALTEAQLLQALGAVGTIRQSMLLVFDPRYSGHPHKVKDLARMALKAAEDAKTLLQGVVSSATRGT